MRPDHHNRPDKIKLNRERTLIKAGIGLTTIFSAAACFAAPEAATLIALPAAAMGASGGIYLSLTDPYQN